MNKDKNFFKDCFNIVAGLNVENESQSLAKEVVLSELAILQQENEDLKSKINETIEYVTANKDKLCRLDETKGKMGVYVSCDEDLLKILQGSDSE